MNEKIKYTKTVITPYRHPLNIPWQELWQYRELLWTLAYRDFRIRYAQTFIGIAWGVINPLLTLLILSFVFGVVAQVPTNGTPHLVYTLTGLCAWTYFAQVVGEAGTSIVGAQDMVQKIYFPRLIIPLSKAVTALIDLVIVLGLLAILLVIYQIPLTPKIIWLPLFILLAILCGLAGGIWLSALTIRFRDFRFITPLLLRLGMFATPIAYPTSAVPESYQFLFYLNPMAGVVDGFRWSILGGTPPHDWAWLSFSLLFLLFVTGLIYFNSVEREIADII
ncbi:MAG: ABC transporter permease [Saprospiraceae bacterium]